LGYISLAESLGISSTSTTYAVRAESYRFRWNNAINGHYAVQGHNDYHSQTSGS